MLTQRTRGLQTTVLFCQALLVTLVFVVVAQVTFAMFFAGSPAGLERYPIYCGLLILGLAVEALYRDKEDSSFGRDFLVQHGVSLRQSACAIGVLLVFLAAAKDAFISRTFLAFLAPSVYLALLWSNMVLPRLVARRIFRGLRRERVLLVGSRERAERLQSWMQAKEVFGLRVVGLLGEKAPGAVENPALRWLGETADLDRVIAEHRITQVILLELPEFSESHRQMVRSVEGQGARLLILNNLAEKLNHPVVNVEDDGRSFIALREEPLENPLNRILKRVLDVTVALPVVIFVVPPLAAVIWLVQRWQSPGPVFFRQRRAGIQSEEFDIIKFRTMHADNPEAARQASPEDERVYPFGRWLRRLSLDELPQFLNVVRGQMSVVGPRPHMVEHNVDFARLMGGYHLRSFVKPGITGLAQVRGFRGEVHSVADIRHRLESDISYLEDWRLVLDVAIIFRTALQILLVMANGIFRKVRGPRAEPVHAWPAQAAESGAPESYSPAYFRRDYRQILGLRFFVGSAAQAVAIGMEGGLVVAPAAPMLLALEDDPSHRAAVLGSDLLLTDSGLLVLLWKLMTGESVTRVSGLEYLQLLLAQPALREPGATFWVMPNPASMAINLAWLQDHGLPVTAADCYLAPAYDRGNVTDPALLEILRQRRPRHVVMAIGGGVQEKLGADLLRQLDYRPAMHCTGAAIGFMSGDQVAIPRWADRCRLGWLFRCFDRPATFIPRYWASRKLLSLMIEYHGRLPDATGPDAGAKIVQLPVAAPPSGPPAPRSAGHSGQG